MALRSNTDSLTEVVRHGRLSVDHANVNVKSQARRVLF